MSGQILTIDHMVNTHVSIWNKVQVVLGFSLARKTHDNFIPLYFNGYLGYGTHMWSNLESKEEINDPFGFRGSL